MQRADVTDQILTARRDRTRRLSCGPTSPAGGGSGDADRRSGPPPPCRASTRADPAETARASSRPRLSAATRRWRFSGRPDTRVVRDLAAHGPDHLAAASTRSCRSRAGIEEAHPRGLRRQAGVRIAIKTWPRRTRARRACAGPAGRRELVRRQASPAAGCCSTLAPAQHRPTRRTATRPRRRKRCARRRALPRPRQPRRAPARHRRAGHQRAEPTSLPAGRGIEAGGRRTGSQEHDAPQQREAEPSQRPALAELAAAAGARDSRAGSARRP